MNQLLKKCVEYLNKGLELKRQGKYSEAIDQYHLARHTFPTYNQIYYNLGKIYFFDSGLYNSGLRSFFTYAHLNLVQKQPDLDLSTQIYRNGYYDFNGFLDSRTSINSEWAFLQAKKYSNFAVLFNDINLTLYTGLYFGLTYPQIFEFHNINLELISNQVSLVLGTNNFQGMGEIIAETREGNLIRNIGFRLLFRNLLIQFYRPEDIINIYFRDDTLAKLYL